MRALKGVVTTTNKLVTIIILETGVKIYVTKNKEIKHGDQVMVTFDFEHNCVHKIWPKDVFLKLDEKLPPIPEEELINDNDVFVIEDIDL